MSTCAESLEPAPPCKRRAQTTVHNSTVGTICHEHSTVLLFPIGQRGRPVFNGDILGSRFLIYPRSRVDPIDRWLLSPHLEESHRMHKAAHVQSSGFHSPQCGHHSLFCPYRGVSPSAHGSPCSIQGIQSSSRPALALCTWKPMQDPVKSILFNSISIRCPIRSSTQLKSYLIDLGAWALRDAGLTSASARDINWMALLKGLPRIDDLPEFLAAHEGCIEATDRSSKLASLAQGLGTVGGPPARHTSTSGKLPGLTADDQGQLFHVMLSSRRQRGTEFLSV